jgi:hypothetical protein
MTAVVKGIVITVIVLAVVIVIIVGAGVYWVSSHGGALLEKSKQSVADGQKFGKTTDNQGCLTEVISRHKQDPALSSTISTQLFLMSCLQSSRETPGFCDEVPKRLEFIKSGQWQTSQCARNDLRDAYCPQLFSQVQTFCEMRHPSQ